MITKKEIDGEHPASHYLVVEDPEKPSTWHLRVRDVNGKLDHRLMGQAWAALFSNFRGNRYEGPQREEAIAKLRRLYEEEGMTPPDEREPEKTLKGIKLLADDDKIVIGGYGIVWGESDLYGDVFAPTTELYLERVRPKPVFYDHALHGIKDAIGEVTVESPDDYGVWVEAELYRHHRYLQYIRDLIRRGVLGWSSGAVAHLVRRKPTEAGKTLLERWPVFEFSLTPVPAEPRTLGVQEMKMLNPAAVELFPEGEGKAPSGKATSLSSPGVPMDTDIMMNEPTTSDFIAPSPPEQPTVEAQPTGTATTELTPSAPKQAAFAVRHLRHPLGDSETLALVAWLRTGDGGTYGDVRLAGDKLTLAIKASDAAMTVAVGADGGYAVPTGHLNTIVAKRDEQLLATVLGVRRIPGQGTTVNVPVEADAGTQFVATPEQNSAHANNFARRKPDLAQVPMTLVKYTLAVELTDELMNDQASNLMAFLEDYVARSMARTHNQLLLTAVATDGTLLKTFASNAGIAAGEPQDIVGNTTLSPYLADDGSVAWVGQSATYWAIAKITGNPFLYAPTPAGQRRELLGYPFFFSQMAAPIGANNKSLFFGNWSYVGWREDPTLTLLRDPYSTHGILTLRYFFRTVYKVLVASAIGYGKHPA